MENLTEETQNLQNQNNFKPICDQQFFRGQVWWLKGAEAYKTKIVNGIETLDENGMRPVIIISNNVVNRSKCDYITVIPCTSNLEREGICTNVTYTNFKGKKSCIQANQIMCVKKSKLVSYFSTVSEELLAEIEQAVKIQLGLENFEGNYFNRYEKIEEENKIAKNENVLEEFQKLKDLLQTKDGQEEQGEKVNLSLVESINNSNLKKWLDDKEEKKEIEIKKEEMFDQYDVWTLEKWKQAVASEEKILWNPNREYEFIKFYKKYGTKGIAEKTGMKYQTVATKIYKLRKKYKDLKKIKNNKDEKVG